MKDIAAFIISLFQDLKLPVKWGAIILSGLVLVFGFMGYEKLTGHFYLSKLEKKVELLGDLQLLATAGIEDDKELFPIYKTIVGELSSFDISQQYLTNLPRINFGDPVTVGKAISGASLWLLLVAVGIPTEVKKDGKLTGLTIGLGIFLLLIGALFAWLGSIIPTLIRPWVNYILFPSVQGGILYLLTRKKK